MTRSRISVTIIGLCLGCAAVADADTELQNRVTAALSQDDGWDETGAALIAENLELSFALHDSIGALDKRTNALRRLNGMLDAQRLAVSHPGYLDAFLLEPELYTTAIQRLGLDHIGEEQLLAAILVRPTAEGLRDSARLIDHFGADLARLSAEPAFADFFEALSWVADDGPPDLTDWLGNRLREMSPDDIAMMTELFVTHLVQLRDRENALYLESTWAVLDQVRRTNPALFNLLLSHRDIWHAISPDLVEAMQIQLGRDVIYARNALVLLLGAEGALFEMSESLRWDGPLEGERLKTAITIFKENNDAAMAVMFQFRDNPRFWDFAGDEDTRALLPCLVAKAKQKLPAIEEKFQADPDAVKYECRREANAFIRALPLYSLFKLAEKYIAGAPITAGDIGSAGFDVVTALMPLGKAVGIGGRIGLGARLARPPTGSGQTVKLAQGLTKSGAVLESGFGTTVTRLIEAEAKRVASAGMQTGVGNAFRMGHETLKKAMATHPNVSAATKELIEEYAIGAPIELAADTLSTEFLRCTSQPVTQMEEDQLCKDLVPLFIDATNPEDVQ
jgi:hypothetical protein